MKMVGKELEVSGYRASLHFLNVLASWHTLSQVGPEGPNIFVVAVCLFVFSFGLHPRPMEVPRLGAELELQPPAYTTATAA